MPNVFTYSDRILSRTRFQLVGDWYTLPQLRQMLDLKGNQGLKRDMARAIREFLILYQITLTSGLESGGRSLGAMWEHSPNYDSWTGIVGIRSGQYLAAINEAKIIQERYALSLVVSSAALAAASPGAKAPLEKYASWFEYGTMNQPSRPLWQLAFKRVGGGARLGRMVQGAIGRRLRAL